jgi:uncharacterized protein YkwD
MPFFYATVAAQAQVYYYYPSAITYTPVASLSSAAPMYYWPSGYQGQTGGTIYSGPYYQTPYSYWYYQAAYTPQIYPMTYTAQYYQTDTQSQTNPPNEGTQVIQASYTTSNTQQSVTTEATVPGGDPYGFTAWLNGTRAAYGLGPVGYDPNLSSWAAMNNSQQAAYGIGHFVMGPARRQNSAMGGFPGIESMWMASPAHRAALLDPTIRWIGIAGLGAYWTFNAN